MPNPANPQSWNRYSYGNNSPVHYNDPTGHYATYDDSSTCVGEDCANAGKINYLFNHPDKPDQHGGYQEGPGEVISNDYDGYGPTIPLDPTLPANPPDINHDPSNQVNQKPDWEKVIVGVSIIFVVDFLIALPIGIGLVEFFPELEIAMILTEAWSWPLIAMIGTANVYGFKLIREGLIGQNEP